MAQNTRQGEIKKQKKDRRAYFKPALIEYGPIRCVTTGGSLGGMEGMMGMGMGMGMADMASGMS